jgi:signal transduction histidine kinase
VKLLRSHLQILILSAVLPGVLVISIVVWRAFAINRDVSERRLLESARVDASALDRAFDATIDALRGLATSPTLDRDDLQAFYLEARRIQSAQTDWDAVTLLSSDNQQLISTRLPWGTPSTQVFETDSLKQLAATQQPVIGLIRNAPGGGPEHLFAIRVPVIRDGALKYAVSAIVNVDALENIVPRQSRDSDEWTRAILDPDGTIAVRTRGPEGYIGAQANDTFRERLRTSPDGLSNEVTREGIAVYAARSRGRFGWTAVVVVPRATLDMPLRTSMIGLLTGGALFMVCGLIGVFVVSRRLTREIAAAASAARALAEGRPVQPTDAHVAETDLLQRSLVSASSLLAQRERERTDEIRRADAARARAEEADRAKDQFLAVLGHELRNPLAPALTALELMRARDTTVFTREREVLERQVVHMMRLVNDLLDVSRLSRGKVQLTRRRFEVRDAVDRAVDMAAPLMNERRHTVTVSVANAGLTIEGDIDRIVQALSNLLTNAARYTPTPGVVSVTASHQDGHVVIACEDSGPGIPADLVARLFTPFEQGPRAMDRREGGLGLGLALARTFIELHGGTIRYERAANGGSRFVATLPMAIGASEDAPEPIPAVARTTRRILLVDDNLDAREMMRSALDAAGHVVCIAGSSEEAMSIAAEFRPQVAILDIGLPGTDGYQLARLLKTLTPHMGLIALTGFGQPADVDAATAAGFDAHRAKPITTVALLETIEETTALYWN